MANRDNHYEAAFEAWLRERRVPYVAVDEARRSRFPGGSTKNVDFIVSPSHGFSWLVDVKGRRFPAGQGKQYWKNWSTRDDLVSLDRWERWFGERFGGLLVFAYNVIGNRSPLPAEQLFEFRERLYGFVGIRVSGVRHACPGHFAKVGYAGRLGHAIPPVGGAGGRLLSNRAGDLRMNRSNARNTVRVFFRRAVRRVLVMLVIAGCLLLTPAVSLAAKKKEPEAPPTKSYVLPYIIVMSMLGVGIMVVCRPSKRADKVEETKKADDEED